MIWPTAGSLERALRDNLPMICTDCYEKRGNSIFGGFMHHGRMLPQGIARQLFIEYQEMVARERSMRRSAPDSGGKL